MARLTRTQKYADLRNQLENGHTVDIQNENIVKTVEDKQEETIQPVIEPVVKPVENIEPVQPEVETPVESDDFVSLDLDSLLVDSVKNLNPEPVVSQPEPVVEEPVKTTEPVVEPQQPIVLDSVVEPISVEPTIELDSSLDLTNNYLEECLNEVNEYNKSKGLMTDDDIPSTILNEIHGTINDIKPVEEEFEDEEFTNTVTLEIKKILSELDEIEDVATPTPTPVATPSPVEQVVEPTPVVEEQPVIEEKLVQAQVAPTIEEQPTSEEEVNDILNAYLNADDGDTDLAKTMTVGKIEDVPAETDRQVAEDLTIQATLLSDQIPLEVKDASELVAEETEEEDDEEEFEQPNRILNYILGGLIVVLFAILIYIGYMILVAQGIL